MPYFEDDSNSTLFISQMISLYILYTINPQRVP